MLATILSSRYYFGIVARAVVTSVVVYSVTYNMCLLVLYNILYAMNIRKIHTNIEYIYTKLVSD